jgi:histidinol-phosphate aminotransferase
MAESPLAAAAADPVISIGGNTNNYGPGTAALQAAQRALGPGVGRYPGNRKALVDAIAARLEVKPENVLLGVGSTYVVCGSVIAFTSPTRPVLQAEPTFEDPHLVAAAVKAPVKSIRLDKDLRHDLDAMAAAAKGAGLVYVCNPNNPTATIVSEKAMTAFVEKVLASSPDTAILIDEAYQDFVVDPSFASAVPLAVKHERVVVTRTFSKVHGMAGLRIGYGIGTPATLKAIDAHRNKLDYHPADMNAVSAAAAIAAINDSANIARQRDLNRKAIEMTVRTFKAAGCRVTDSQANFIFADVQRPTKEFRDACAQLGVRIGRDFPPLTTYARISMGTLEEMQRANEVFRQVLGASRPTAGL